MYMYVYIYIYVYTHDTHMIQLYMFRYSPKY